MNFDLTNHVIECVKQTVIDTFNLPLRQLSSPLKQKD